MRLLRDARPKRRTGSAKPSVWKFCAAALFTALLLTFLLAVPTRAADDAPDARLRNQNNAPGNPQLTTLVREILQHEISAQAEDHTLWCYRKLVEKEGKKELFAACQTKLGEVDRLLAQDSHPLNQQQRQQENQRIEKLLGHTEQLKKKKQQQTEDDKQATQLLRMIPDAFLFEQQNKDDQR